MAKTLTIKRLEQAAKVLKVIAHPDRLRIVECLEKKEMSVQELQTALKASQVEVSKHLALLKKNEVVASRVEKNFRYYSILNRNVLGVLGCMRIHA